MDSIIAQDCTMVYFFVETLDKISDVGAHLLEEAVVVFQFIAPPSSVVHHSMAVSQSRRDVIELEQVRAMHGRHFFETLGETSLDDVEVDFFEV